MRFKKSVIAGAIALSTLAGAGAASAATNSVSDYQDTLWNMIVQQRLPFSTLIRWSLQPVDPDMNWQNMVLAPSSTTGTSTTGTSTRSGTTTGTSTEPTGTSAPAPTASSAPAPTGTASTAAATQSAYAGQVVSLVNQERAKAGLKPLAVNPALTEMALDKAKDMYNNHYFSHTSPTYGSPFDMMKSYGISYSYAGENIAMGQKTPQEVMNAWMNSTGHRQNILSPNYTKIGVGYYNSEWVQEFIAN